VGKVELERDIRAGADLPLRWHALPHDEVLSAFGVDAEGMTSSEAARRLQQYGPNALPAERSRSFVSRFLAQFNHLLIYVLLGATTLAAAMGHWFGAR
jgi:magnesium-transporting ATPase (P-type)